jgi:hypothetical protein
VVKLTFATWANAEYQGRILTEEDARRRLLSYWELKDLPPDLLKQYAEKGKAGKRKKVEDISLPETE